MQDNLSAKSENREESRKSEKFFKRFKELLKSQVNSKKFTKEVLEKRTIAAVLGQTCYFVLSMFFELKSDTFCMA